MKRKLHELLVFAILYSALFGLYYFTSKGVDSETYLINAIIILIASFVAILPYYFFWDFKLRNFLPELMLACLYSTMQPILAYHAYAESTSILFTDFDIVQGPLLFAALALIHSLYNKYVSAKYLKSCNAVYICLLAFLSLPILLHLTYFFIFSHPLTINAMHAIMQTNVHEAAEYLAHLSLSIKLCLPIVSLLMLYWFSKMLLSQRLEVTYRRQNKIFPFATILTTCTITLYALHLLPEKTKTLGPIISTQQYFASIERYKSSHTASFRQLLVTPNSISNQPQTIILVIGESATRDYMKAFTHDLPDDTTPWLTQARADKNMLLFPNAYACANATILVLEHALTESNYYNNKEFFEAISIIDMAKKAGYKTYWFSNQGKIGPYDTPITLVAETADIASWNDDKAYDDSLLAFLDTVDNKQNNFIVLHLYGSHVFYSQRYPHTYQKWTDDNVRDKEADYKNSLLFTDHVLQQIYDYGQQKLNMQAMIYFSDHGSEPAVPRDPDSAAFITFRIPMFIYLSPDYQQRHKSVAERLQQNTQRYFTNDLMFNTICGILDIQSNHYDESESLTSTDFRFDLRDLKTDNGKLRLKDDPLIKASEDK